MKALNATTQVNKNAALALTGLVLLSNLTLSRGQTIVPIPTLGGSSLNAHALNDQGQVAGLSFLTGDRTQHGFLFSGGILTDLGTLQGTQSQAASLNTTGVVVGDATTANDTETHAFLFRDGIMTDLGTLGGTYSTASAVNEHGSVAGFSSMSNPFQTRAFLYAEGNLLDLGTLGGSTSSAIDLNNRGQVIGVSATANDRETHPFLYSEGRLTDLGTLGGPVASAFDLNEAGLVVGESWTANWESHAFLYLDGQMTDLGTLGGTFSSAFAINERGQIIGQSSLPGDRVYHAFLYAGGTMVDLGTLGGTDSIAHDLNEQGLIVGAASNPAESSRAFLWQNGIMTDLNSLLPADSGWALWSARSINNSGQIFGYGLHQGAFAWYLLTLPSPNRPPLALAGPDQSHACPGAITLDGSNSSDPDGDALTFAWRQEGVLLGQTAALVLSLPPGSYTFDLTVTDPAGATDQDSLTVLIADTTPPSVTCPRLQPLTAGPTGTVPLPDLTRSVVAFDNCTDPASLHRAQSPPPGTVLGVGEHLVTVTVTDAAGNHDSCSMPLVVEQPCRLDFQSLSATPDVIRPPNKQMVSVSLVPQAVASCDGDLLFQIVAVTSSDDGAGWTYKTAPDWEITGPLTLNLRAEISPQAVARVYTVTVQCSDPTGNQTTRSVTVAVQRTPKPLGTALLARPRLLNDKERSDLPVKPPPFFRKSYFR